MLNVPWRFILSGGGHMNGGNHPQHGGGGGSHPALGWPLWGAWVGVPIWTGPRAAVDRRSAGEQEPADSQGTGSGEAGAGTHRQAVAGRRRGQPDATAYGGAARDTTAGLDIEDRTARVEAAVDEATRLRQKVDELGALRAVETERLRDKTFQGRQLAHEIKGELSVLIGAYELIQHLPELTAEHHQLLSDEVTRIERVAGLVDQLHALVKGLEPTT